MRSSSSTGSVSQDALRLGFQTTCDAGIAKLLKVHDITTEACASFRERHIEDIKESCDTLCKRRVQEQSDEFMYRMMTLPRIYDDLMLFQFIKKIQKRQWLARIKNQEPRNFDVKILTIYDPELNLREGKWETTVDYVVILDEWEGFTNKGYIELEREAYERSHTVVTTARVCQVKYIPYDCYTDRYIPDEVTDIAAQAISIGMTNLQVAVPMIQNAREQNCNDPIIVGFVADQMFLIAWFGYNNDHMSVNM